MTALSVLSIRMPALTMPIRPKSHLLPRGRRRRLRHAADAAYRLPPIRRALQIAADALPVLPNALAAWCQQGGRPPHPPHSSSSNVSQSPQATPI